MTKYATILLLGLVLFAGCYLLLCRKEKLSLPAAALSLPFQIVFALLFAKITYLLCFFDPWSIDEYWFEDNFLSFNPREFSIVGGAAGLYLGLRLSLRLMHQKKGRYLDAAAPAAAFLLGVIRFAESEQGRLGAGPLLPEGSWLARFPLGLSNEYGEWFFSVFFLETVTAFVAGLIFLGWKGAHEGRRFEYTAFYLALTQIFCESLRAISLKWGFVRIEQVLCGVFILVLVFYHNLKTPGTLKRFLPSLDILGCIGIIVFVEFALDKFPIPDVVCYIIMLLALTGMACLEHFSVRRSESGAGNREKICQ